MVSHGEHVEQSISVQLAEFEARQKADMNALFEKFSQQQNPSRAPSRVGSVVSAVVKETHQEDDTNRLNPIGQVDEGDRMSVVVTEAERNMSLEKCKQFLKSSKLPEVSFDDLNKNFQKYTEDKMGPPLSKAWTEPIKEIWMKPSILTSKNTRETVDEILVPENATFLSVERLPPGMFEALNKNAKTKDKAAQSRIKNETRAVIPVLRAIDSLQKVAARLEKGRVVKPNDVRDISSELMKTVVTLNLTVSEANRKRRNDTTESLGKSFKQFSQTATGKEKLLFDEEETKKMDKLLTQRDNNRKPYSRTPYNPGNGGGYKSNQQSKNYQSPGRRGGYNRQNNYRSNQGSQSNQSPQSSQSKPFFGGKFKSNKEQ